MNPGSVGRARAQAWGEGRPPGGGSVSARPWRASLGAQVVKKRPEVRETGVRSLFGEDPLEKGRATHSSVLAWRIPQTVEPGGLQSMGVAKSQT